MARKRKKENIEILQKAKEITTNEVQLLQWPYFCVSTAHPDDTEVEYTEILKLNGGEIRRRWVVRCHQSFGWPGQLEADVWRSVEHVMHQQREMGMLSNPIVTTLSQIRRNMPSKWQGGRDLKLIIKAIKCLTLTSVDCDFFYDAQEKVSRNASFSLIHEWAFDRRQTSTGKEMLDKTRLLIHRDVFNNIAAAHVRPLDRGFRDNINSWLAKRLYEILGVKFYALRNKKVPYRTRYSRICALLGCKRQQYLCHAKRVIGRAHKELQESQFLSKVEWYVCTTDQRDWVIHYWPGKRAKSEWKSEYFSGVEISCPLFIEKLPEIGTEPVWMEDVSSDETATVAKVVSRLVENNETESTHEKFTNVSSIDADRLEIATSSSNGKQNICNGNKNRDIDKESDLTKKDSNINDLKVNCRITDEEVISVFEQVTGTRRRVRGLSEAEQVLIQDWRNAGITLEVIINGINRVLKREADVAKSVGRSIRSIWSLEYCAWAVWESFDDQKRQHKENCDHNETNRSLKEETHPHKERRQAYEHLTDWPSICEKMKKWLAPNNYVQVVQEIAASRIDDGTLYLVVSDLYWKDHILDTYQKHFLEASGADELKIDIDLGG